MTLFLTSEQTQLKDNVVLKIVTMCRLPEITIMILKIGYIQERRKKSEY